MTTSTRTSVPPTRGAPAPALRAARRAITAVFAVNGLLVATYLARIPALKASLHLTDGQLSAILTCWGVTALAAMQLVGRLVSRWGSARIVVTAVVALPFALYAVGGAGSPGSLAVAVGVSGAIVGTLDAAMNAHAVVVERRLGRPILSGCHAAVSGSALVASLLGAATVRAGVPMTTQIAWLGAVALVVVAVACPALLPARADQRTDDGPRSVHGWRAGWTRPVLVLGAVGMALMLCEAAVISWGGVFLHTERGAGLAQAALAYGVFTLFQTLGRFAGDPLTRRIGRARAFRAHALVAVAGLLVVVAGRPAPVSLAGFALLGLGTSVLVPLVVSTVGQVGGEGPGAAVSVSRVTTFVYAGILVGPAAVGWLGETVGLAWTFACLLPLPAFAVAAARVVRTPSGPPAPDA